MQNSLYRLLIISVIILLNIDIVQSQLTPQSLTNYKSERKSFNLVAQREEFVMVENGDNLSVLSIDEEGQLYIVYTSSKSYCHDSAIINVDMNDQYILYYYGDYIIFENFLSGDIRKIENIEQPETYSYPKAYFVNNDYFEVRLDESYLYDIQTISLIKTTPYGVTAVKNLVNYFKGNSTVVIDSKNKKNYTFYQRYVNDAHLFDGLIFQRAMISDFSYLNEIYFVNQNGSVDTVVGNFPLFDHIDRKPFDKKIFMTIKNLIEQKVMIYEYDIEAKNLILVDSINEYHTESEYFLNDSIYFYKNNYQQNLYNFKSHKKITLDLCWDYYSITKKGDILSFLGYQYAPLTYDLRNNKLSKLVNETYEKGTNFTKIYKNDKLYLFDLNYLNHPYYEISDSIYKHQHQNVLSSADQNGLRTSLLKSSENFIYTFDDNDIIVLDSTQVLGYRKKKIISHNTILGTFDGFKWATYGDNIFVLIPVIKNNTTHYDLIKVNLNDLSTTNISEQFGWIDTLKSCNAYPTIRPVNYINNEILIFGNKIYNMKTNESDVIPNSFIGMYAGVLLNDKLVLFGNNFIAEFTYPQVSHLQNKNMNELIYFDDAFYMYNIRNQNNTYHLAYSDGLKHEVIPNSSGFKVVTATCSYPNSKPFVLLNPVTKHVKLYSIVQNSNGSVEMKEEMDVNYSNPVSFDQLSSSEYVVFSDDNINAITTYIIDIKSGRINTIPNLSHYYDVFFVNKDEILGADNKDRMIKKYSLNGNLENSRKYPDFTDFVYNLRNINLRMTNLYVFDRFDYKNNNSKLFFDAHKFEFVFDTECKEEYYKYSQYIGENILYKDSNIYFNAELNGKGRQIYKLNNSSRTTSTYQLQNHPLTVYPNPANDKLELNIEQPCDIQSVQIFDLLGKQQALSYTSCSSHLNISHLAQGAYIITINQKGKKFVSKFVKM